MIAHLWLGRRLVLAVAFTAPFSGVLAQDTIIVVGTAKITLPDTPPGGPGASRGSIDIPVRYSPADGRTSPVFETRLVQLSGAWRAESTFRVRLVPGGQRELVYAGPKLAVDYDPRVLQDAGDYTLVVEAAWKPASRKHAFQVLTFTFNRPATEINSAAPRRVVRTLFPILWFEEKYAPTSILLEERSGRTSFVPRAVHRLGDLFDDAHMPTGERLRLTLPTRIGPRGQDSAVIDVYGPLRLGNATATVTVPARALTNGATDVAIEVVTRPGVVVVAVVIIAGIALGYLVRHQMEDARVMAHARAVVASMLADLARDIDDMRDIAYKARLERVRNDLEAARDKPLTTATKIEEAVVTASTGRTATLGGFETARAELHVALGDWQQAVADSATLDGTVAKAVEVVRAHLAAFDRDLADGEVTKVSRELVKAQTANLIQPLQRAIDESGTSVRRLIAAVGSWPGTRVGTLTSDLEQEAQKIVTDSATASDAGSVRAVLARTAYLNQRVGQLIARGLPDVVTLARAVADDLVALAPGVSPEESALLEKVADLRAAIDALERKLAIVDDGLEARGQLVAELENVQKRARAAFDLLLAHAGSAQTDVKAALDGRDLRKAADLAQRALTEAWAARALPTPGFKPHSSPESMNDPFETLPPSTSGLNVSLDQLKGAVVGRSMTVHATIKRGTVEVTDGFTIQWFIANKPAPLVGQSATSLTFVPQSHGDLVVAALVVDDAGHARRRVSQTATVREAPAVEAKLEEERARRIERIQTAILGVIIVMSGILIFDPLLLTWTQTILIPFVWGFMTDIGAARLGQLASSAMTKGLPVP